jgi:hypothetical protein
MGIIIPSSEASIFAELFTTFAQARITRVKHSSPEQRNLNRYKMAQDINVMLYGLGA